MHNFRELEMSLISVGTLGGTIAMVEGEAEAVLCQP
ncbi:hypothetical protein BR10RB9215_C11648 [Brucella sp. 10RB9215]|nr:hypothetical protein BR10RB9215_C11648 [Brucella sp. 10RB9215]